MKYRIKFESMSPFDDKWHPVINDTDDPWQQYNKLKEWERTKEQPVSNVHLFEIVEELVEIKP